MISAVILSPDLQESSLRPLIEALTLAQVFDVVVVVRGNDNKNLTAPQWFEGKIVTNASGGELSSVLRGLDSLDEKELHGIVICSSDQRLSSQAVFVDLLHLFWKEHRPIITPLQNSKREFPTLISNVLFAELRGSPLDADIASIIESHANDLLEVEMDDAGLIRTSDQPMTADAGEGGE